MDKTQFTHGDREGQPLPNQGTTTGVKDSYGADLSGDATNRIGGIGRSTNSDPAGQCKPPGDRVTHVNPGASDYEVPYK